MDKILVKGGNVLKGEIYISGAKNAALPIMAAALLTDEEVKIKNIPLITDIDTMAELLKQHGAEISLDRKAETLPHERALIIKANNINNLVAPYDLVRKMRASIVVLGPLLTKFREVKISLPGGCAIGVRPVDLHVSAMEKLGAQITLENGYIHAVAPEGLRGTEIVFDKITVTGTENVIMAACLAKGITVIKNAACEPEVLDLINMLISMGAKIKGGGQSTIEIEGVEKLNGTTHTLIGDRLEAGTYAVAAAITGGDLKLKGVNPDFLEIALNKLVEAGITVNKGKDWIHIKRDLNTPLAQINFETEPFPGFPTDLQAQMMTLATLNKGVTSTIVEHIFENRFMHVLELVRLGADISVHGNTAIIRGVEKLVGAEIMATDLRASVSLVLAGLVAEGETVINRAYHLFRGYDDIIGKLTKCGADIQIVKG